MFKSSTKHLDESNCGYIEHFKFALYAAFLLFVGALASLIHAFIPGIFRGTSAYIVIKLYKERLENHPNSTYQNWIKNEFDNQRNNQ